MRTNKLIRKAQKGIQIPIPGLYGTMGAYTPKMTNEQLDKILYYTPAVGTLWQAGKTIMTPTEENKDKLINSALSDAGLLVSGVTSKVIPAGKYAPIIINELARGEIPMVGKALPYLTAVGFTGKKILNKKSQPKIKQQTKIDKKQPIKFPFGMKRIWFWD